MEFLLNLAFVFVNRFPYLKVETLIIHMELTPFRNFPKINNKIPDDAIINNADLCLKYKPTTFDDFIGNKNELDIAKTWIQNYESPEKMAIVYAPPGVGKSILLELIHKTYNKTLNIVSTKDKNMDEINSILKGEHQRTILEAFKEEIPNKNKLILIDDIDLKIQNEKDFIYIISECVKKNNIRVFCTASSAMIRKLNKIKNIKTIIFNRVNQDDLKQFINKIIRLERIRTPCDFSDHVFKQSNGDVRATMKNLEITLVKNSRSINMDRDQEILTPDLVTELISNKYQTFEQKYRVSQCDTFSLIYSLHQNYPQAVCSIEQMADIANDFSVMDSLTTNNCNDTITSNDCTQGVCIPVTRLTTSFYEGEIKAKKNIKILPYKIISSSNQRIISKNKVENACKALNLNFGINNPEVLDAVKLLATKEKRKDDFIWFFTRFCSKKKNTVLKKVPVAKH
tara:strand:+ start:1600 stop:2964 length:1365 start_codon:yes stop_codon:yes gene_type:complete